MTGAERIGEPFGALLRRFRAQVGLTQEELAEQAGISARAVSDLERGLRSRPYPETVRLLADALELAAEERKQLLVAARPEPSLGQSASAASPRLHRLPVPPTPLVGRKREVVQISGLLVRPEVRLVTLTGPGGTGKTRLALAVAEQVADHFPDRVVFVSLAALTDPALVPLAVAEALGVREEGGKALPERLREYLAAKRLLLVLDNVEHLVDGTAPLVSDLLTAAPGLTVLATSRAPFRLRAEREYPVPPLGLPRRKPAPTAEQLTQYEAVRLFIERAQAVRPDFAVDNANAPAVAEICHRLDGLPLAIELAAPRVRMLSPQAMLARLEQRLPLLTGGARDAPQRQQALRDTIAWSHDLLSFEEQALFQRLAVFAGGATLEAVEAVANPNGQLDVFRGLERLIEHSLLRQEEGFTSEPRVSMLETIREFAWERLEACGEAEQGRKRHIDYFLALAERAEPHILQGTEQRTWLDRLDTENDDLRVALGGALEQQDGGVALRLAAALWRFWVRRGYINEGRNWLERALAVDGDEPTTARSRALLGAGVLAENQGDFEAAQAHLEECLALAQTLADRTTAAAACHHLGNVADALSQPNQATGHYEQALALRRELGDALGTGRTLINLAQVAIVQGDVDRADPFLGEAIGLFQRGGDSYGTAHAHITRADLAQRRGDVEEAERSYQEALRLGRQIDDKPLVAMTLIALGEVARARGDHIHALAAYREALVLDSDLGDKLRVAEALDALAALAETRGEAARGARLLGAADRLRLVTGTRLLPTEEEARERVVSALHKALGEEAFAAARESGRALPLEEAVAEALSLAEELALIGQNRDAG